MRCPKNCAHELIAFRRDLHMHPELGRQEFRTTAAIKARLEQAGLEPGVLPGGTGLICDIGARAHPAAPACSPCAPTSTRCPSPDTKTGAPTARPSPGRAHACGHDVHTTVVLGAGLVLAELRARRAGCRARCG